MKQKLRIGFILSSDAHSTEVREMNALVKLFDKEGQKSTVLILASSSRIKTAGIEAAEEAGEYKAALKLATQAKKLKLDICLFRHFPLAGTLISAKTILKNKLRLVFVQTSPADYFKGDRLNVFRANQLDAWISPLQATANEVRSLTQIASGGLHILPMPFRLSQSKKREAFKADFRKQHSIERSQLVLGVQLDATQALPREAQTLLRSLTQSALLRERLFLYIEWVNRAETSSKPEFESLTNSLLELGMRNSFIQLEQSNWSNDHLSVVDIALIIADEEPYSQKAQEAMERGVHCLGSGTQITTELLRNGEYGWLYIRGSEESMLEAFGYILHHTDENQASQPKPSRMKRPDYVRALLNIMTSIAAKA